MNETTMRKNKTIIVVLACVGAAILVYLGVCIYLGIGMGWDSRQAALKMNKYTAMSNQDLMNVLEKGNPGYPDIMALNILAGRKEQGVTKYLMKKIEFDRQSGIERVDARFLLDLSRFKHEDAWPYVVERISHGNLKGQELTYVEILKNYAKPDGIDLLRKMSVNIDASAKVEAIKEQNKKAINVAIAYLESVNQ